MILSLLILLPFVAGILSFALKGAQSKSVALVSSIAIAFISIYLACTYDANHPLQVVAPWIPSLGAQFNLYADGMATMLCLLTGILAPIIIISSTRTIERENAFYGFIMFAIAGLMGVFLAGDALLFYVFWEVALIPVYFLCSIWGGERRIPVTFKFFVYTFVGSLMLLSAIIYLALQSPGSTSYAFDNIMAAGRNLPEVQQQGLFWLVFLAFAIKMPIFPFHTWQPDAYEQSPTPVTIILSALMVKMGLFAVIRWLLPVLPAGVDYWSNIVIILSVIGILYASVIAFKQTDIKRLIAYSSIAHMGLMSAVAFAGTNIGMHGLMVQMFNHGINIAGMWLIVTMIENRYGTRDMTKLGGMASAAPKMAIALVIIAFANIALPLTNGFVGEYMLFNGLFQSANDYHITYMVAAGLGIILGAGYTLNMLQKVAFGNKVEVEGGIVDLSMAEYLAVAVIIVLIIVLGVYPAPLLQLTA